MEKGSIDKLRGIWNFIGSPNMNQFTDRIMVQKKVYILQQLGYEFDYKFNLYIHGPYSSSLAKDGFEINISNSIASNDSENEKMKKFKLIEKGHEGDIYWLEMIATIIYLARLSQDYHQIKNYLIENKPYLYSESGYDEAFNRLLSLEIIKNK